MEAVKACQTTEREPIYESRGATHDGYDFGQTYIEVDLATQHLYSIKMESDHRQPVRIRKRVKELHDTSGTL